MAAEPDLVQLVRTPRGEPAGAIVLLHGRGTSEYDLAPLLDELDPGGRLVGVTPRAPLALAPGGAHWYAVHRVGFPDPATFGQTFDRLCAWFDALPRTLGVPVERTIVGGFSQGAVMSYALALGAGRTRPAGLLALSGFIPAVDGLTLDFEGLEGYPAALGHGSHDPVIDVSFGRAARQRLEAAGADVTWRESRMAHSVDPAYLPELAAWVEAVLPA